MTAQKTSSKNAKYNPFCAIFCKLFQASKNAGEKQKCAQNGLYNNKSNDKTCFYSKCGFMNIIDPLAKVMRERSIRPTSFPYNF